VRGVRGLLALVVGAILLVVGIAGMLYAMRPHEFGGSIRKSVATWGWLGESFRLGKRG